MWLCLCVSFECVYGTCLCVVCVCGVSVCAGVKVGFRVGACCRVVQKVQRVGVAVESRAVFLLPERNSFFQGTESFLPSVQLVGRD